MNTELETSLKGRYEAIIKKAFNYTYEDNPARVGWELHKIDCDVEIINPNDVKANEYYLIGVYLPEDLQDKIIEITESLPMFVDTYLTGRTSIYNMVNYFTPEKLEEQLLNAENILLKVEPIRNEFIKRNKLK